MKLYNKDFIRQIKNGDPKSQKALFTELYGLMYRVCNRYILRQDEAEDCLMKGFMKVFDKLEQFEYSGEESLFFWVRKIMVNEALMVLRKNTPVYLTTDDQLPEVEIDAEVLNKMAAADLNELIKRLPETYRTVFLLNVVEGYPHKEIATMLGITENTSKSQVARAKSKLKVLLEKMNQSYGTTGR